MFILKGIMILIQFVPVPVLAGYLIMGGKKDRCERKSKESYLLGLFFTWALFWLLYLICSVLQTSFIFFSVTFSVLLLGICIISLFYLIRRKEWKIYFNYRDWKKWDKYEIIYLLLFICLLALQLYFAFFYESTVMSYDDYDYVVNAQNMISSNKLMGISVNSAYLAKRSLNSWIPYTAYLSVVSGFHITTVTHTVLPVILLLVAYTVYAYIAECLFDKRENQLIFLIFISLTYIFGYYSHYSMTFRLLATLWQGKAVLSVVVVPFMIVFFSKIYKKEDFNMQKGLCLIIVSAAACSLTMMGGGMICMVLGGIFLVMSISKRKIAGWQEMLCGCTVPVVQILLYFCLR